jgi:hypothetical protein
MRLLLWLAAAALFAALLVLASRSQAMFGPLHAVAVGGTAANMKGLQENTFGGVYGNWCDDNSSSCPNTASYSLAWNLSLRQTLGTGWERLESSQAIMDSGCSGSPNFGSYGNAVSGSDPNIGMDATVSALQGIGIKISMMLGTLANCETGQGAGFIGPSNVSTWASQWVAPVVTHYSARGVHVYEIWNEANGNYSWASNQWPAEALYTQMMCAAYPVIRGIDPQAIVMPSLTTSPGITIDAVTFLSAMYSDGLHGCFNGFANHPYASNGPTNYSLRNGTGEAWNEMYFTSPSLQSTMAAEGDGSVPFYLTEMGCSEIAGSTGESYNYCGNASTEYSGLDQGQGFILDAFNHSANGFPNLGPIFWWEELTNPNYACNAAATDASDNCAGLYNGGTDAAQPMGTTYQSVSGRW